MQVQLDEFCSTSLIYIHENTLKLIPNYHINLQISEVTDSLAWLDQLIKTRKVNRIKKCISSPFKYCFVIFSFPTLYVKELAIKNFKMDLNF